MIPCAKVGIAVKRYARSVSKGRMSHPQPDESADTQRTVATFGGLAWASVAVMGRGGGRFSAFLHTQTAQTRLWSAELGEQRQDPTLCRWG